MVASPRRAEGGLTLRSPGGVPVSQSLLGKEPLRFFVSGARHSQPLRKTGVTVRVKVEEVTPEEVETPEALWESQSSQLEPPQPNTTWGSQEEVTVRVKVEEMETPEALWESQNSQLEQLQPSHKCISPEEVGQNKSKLPCAEENQALQETEAVLLLSCPVLMGGFDQTTYTLILQRSSM
ncbi:reticulocalbin-1-like [Platysternon megacephalum]|uniref:Reticulocalbin-1-like n=1 Tax=Platysternon megacephalum TaxID=55544 RepID=A0A4D9DM71_9SAUR|nr:reticulocalbin-1-like [Platysternon megacephalum]